MNELFSNVGSVLTGLFSSTCCLGPAIFAGLGVGAGTAGMLGGVAGFVKALIPYRPLFIILALGFIAFSFFAVYGRGQKTCATGDASSAKRLKRQKLWLWITSAAVSLLILSPYWLGVM